MTASNLPSLSVVIPMYREQDNVAPMLVRVHEGLAAYGGPWELICVDDGSPDQTGPRLLAGAQAAGAHVRVIRHARNLGQTAAMQSGIDAAHGELIATLDGDLQNDPADIPRMVDELLARDLDLLCGKRARRRVANANRYHSHRRNHSRQKQLGHLRHRHNGRQIRPGKRKTNRITEKL